MGKLVEEVREWNSPIIGAYLLWRFTQSYVHNHPTGDAPVVILHCIANTLLTSPDFNYLISDKRPNLASYVKGFSESQYKKSDVFACLSQRIRKQLSSAIQAIDISTATGLLAWESESAKLFPLEEVKSLRGTATKGMAVQAIGHKAEVLGKWFANLDILTITSSLGVVL
ncbi:MAG: DUF6521 family protein [Holosporaceae bacterium]|jgi:hypothetical protein|nr:DUF6521 family protein [Holosporaceae bacterium]